MVRIRSGAPGYSGLEQNKGSGSLAKDAAERKILDKDSRLAAEKIIAFFLKRRSAEWIRQY